MDRTTRLDKLNRLLPSQFEEVLFRLSVPVSHLPGAYAPQSQRAVAALQWLEGQGRLDALDQYLGITSRRQPLSGGPVVEDGPSLMTLRKEMLKVLEGSDELRGCIEDARLPHSRINLSGSLEIQTQNALSFASRYGGDALARLCRAVVERYPDGALAEVRKLAGAEPSKPAEPRQENPPPTGAIGAFDYHAFVSFSSIDRDWVRSLVYRLRKDGLRVWFDEDSIKWGEALHTSIARGLEKSRFVVLVMSPDYVAGHGGGSGWVELEHQLATSSDPANRTRRVLPLLRRDCDVPPKIRAYLYLDVQTDADYEKHYPQILQTLREG